MTTIHEIVKILTDSGIEPNEANIEACRLGFQPNKEI